MGSSDDVMVLVVEDERELAEMYAAWLEDEYRVRTAHTGEVALESVDEAVDVVLLDRRLPGMTGRDVLDEIRAADYGCFVAMITAVDPDFDIVDMPFDDYIVKPVLEDEIRDLVERLVARSTYDQQVRESFTLASKLAALERAKTRRELESSEEYQKLQERFESVRNEIDATLEEFEDADYLRLYGDLS